MIHARLCETARIAFFFASPRHFDFLDCKIDTSKCFEWECETFRVLKSSSPRFGWELWEWVRMSLYKSLTKEPSLVNLCTNFVPRVSHLTGDGKMRHLGRRLPLYKTSDLKICQQWISYKAESEDECANRRFQNNDCEISIWERKVCHVGDKLWVQVLRLRENLSTVPNIC